MGNNWGQLERKLLGILVKKNENFPIIPNNNFIIPSMVYKKIMNWDQSGEKVVGNFVLV